MPSTIIDCITLGTLRLVGEHIPPMVCVKPGDADPGASGFWITAAEWQSLVALNDVTRQQAIHTTRLRSALREALEMVRVGHADERLKVLTEFLNGEREGL